MAFAALVSGNLGLIFANRSHVLTAVELLRHPNPALWWIIGGTLTALLAVIHVPWLAAVFRFESPAAPLFAAACVAGFASVAWYDLYKMARRLRRA